MSAVDLYPLEAALVRLQEAWDEYQANPQHTLIRDGLIQRFEFIYEIAHKTLKRYLEWASPTPAEVDRLAFPDLIRTANEQGLLKSDWPKWRVFRELRNKTSHTYDEAVALEVIAAIPAFLDEAAYLRDRLKERLNA